MFALIALIVALLGLFGVGDWHFMMLLWAAAVAGHLLLGFYPVTGPGWTRNP